ncbi:MAG: class II fructose-bisphosphate aldolase [Mediterraneibacter gnavus]
MAVCKINIDSDLRLAATAALRESIFNLKSNIDPRQFLDKARENMAEVVSHKIEMYWGVKIKYRLLQS